MIPSFVTASTASVSRNKENDSIAAFSEWARNNRLTLRKSSEKEDKYDHIDYYMGANGAEVSVDIKGQKDGQNRGLFLIEINNVIGKTSWLNGKADYIAFQEGARFLFIDRQKLAEYMKSFNFSNKGPKFCRAPLYYSRFDRPKEKVTWITRSELMKFAEEF